MAQVLFFDIFFEKDPHLSAVEELIRKPFYTMFLSNSCASFHWWFFLLFMPLLLKTVISRLEFTSSF